MKFVELHLDGFGKLVDRTFTFAPGLNLIFGPNEAGKSTLQQAVLALLYGFYDEGSISKARRAFAENFAPWTPGVDFAGSLLYQLDDGRILRVVRSFSGRSSTRLETHPASEDISPTYRSDSYGRLYFANAQLGMDKGVFENTCVVRQAELVALEQSAMAITDTLMHMSASASQDTTTADALARLEETLRDEIGSDRAWTKPLASARQHLAELQASQKPAMETRREVFLLIAELNEAQTDLEELDQETQRLGYLAALAELAAIQAQLDASIQADTEAEHLQGEVERWQAWADFPVHLRDQVIRSEGERTRLLGEIQEHIARASEVQQLRANLAGKLEATEVEVSTLADAKDVPEEKLPEIQRLAAQWEAAQGAERTARTRLETTVRRLTDLEQKLAEGRKELGKSVDLGPIGLAQLQHRWLAARQNIEQAQTALQQARDEWQQVGLSDERFEAMGETARQFQSGSLLGEPPRKGCRFWKRAETPPGPPPEVTIYAQLKPVRDKLEAAWTADRAAKTSFATVDAEVSQYLVLDPGHALDQDRFETVSQQLAQYTRLVSEMEVQQQNVADARTGVEEAQLHLETTKDALVHAFSSTDCEVDDLQSAVNTFEQSCKRKNLYDQAAANLQRLRTEDRLLGQEEQAQTAREESLRQVCQSLCVTLSQAGIEVVSDDLPGAVASFEESHQNHQQWQRAKDTLESALGRPASGLRQEEREASRKRVTDLKKQIAAGQSIHSDWRDLSADRDAHEYRLRMQEHDGLRRTKQERCTQLRETIQRMAADLRHPAELIERISVTQAQIRRLEYIRDVLTLAKEELTAATEEYQRIFAPRLEKVLAEGMARVTQGRYAQVLVDPGTLSVALVAPERNDPVDAAVLSTGTRDLIYLLLRIGISQLMSRTSETLPLLLDDPLVQFDRERREYTLKLLVNLAKETQIILFTKDDETLRWFEKEAGGETRCNVQTLQ